MQYWIGMNHDALPFLILKSGVWSARRWFNINMPSYKHCDFCCGDQILCRPFEPNKTSHNTPSQMSLSCKGICISSAEPFFTCQSILSHPSPQYDPWSTFGILSLYAIFSFNSLRPSLSRRPFADDIFKCIFFNKNVWITINISLKCVPKGLINNIPALVHILACHRSGGKPLSEPMMVRLLTHICGTRPQWVNMVLTILSATKPR